MSSQGPTHAERQAALLAEGARVGGLSVLFSQAVAERAGLNSTDMESLDLLLREGPMTAGRLAELTGLSTGGAITALIDRLERRGFVRRERGAEDRRQVIVRAAPERAERELGPYFASLDRAMRELGDSYSDEELAVILDYMTRTSASMLEQIARVRRGTSAETTEPSFNPATAPGDA